MFVLPIKQGETATAACPDDEICQEVAPLPGAIEDASARIGAEQTTMQP
jgi:hypothetical protein